MRLVKLVALSTTFWVTSYNVPEHTPTPIQNPCRAELHRKAMTYEEWSRACTRNNKQGQVGSRYA